MMLVAILVALRRWEEHIARCEQCGKFDSEEEGREVMPCGIGRALLLNMKRILEEGI